MKLSLAIFHHNMDNNCMKVVENDKVISGMLQDELKRCQEMLNSLKKPVSELPKGVINERKKRYKDKVYSYFYLKYREGKKVINEHIPNNHVKDLLKKLELRKKYEKEIQSYKSKIAYLNKIMRAGKEKSDTMKKEYDFSKAEQGKFYRPIEKLEIPVYLDKEVKEFFSKTASKKKIDLNKIVNTILRKEMETLKAIGV